MDKLRKDFKVLGINEWLDAIGCDRAYKKDMKATYEKAKVELQAQIKDTLRQVLEWGLETCPHTKEYELGKFKRACSYCWQELKVGK